MGREELRPVGTEFVVYFPADVHSTNGHAHRARYRVVAHREVQLTRDPDGPFDWGEELEALEYCEVPYGEEQP